jgi:hypothetical protein
MTKANTYLRVAEDDGARVRPEREFNAGRICSVSVFAIHCPTADDVRAHAAHMQAIREQAFKPRVVCPQGEHPKENGDGTGPVSEAQADAKSRDAPTLSAIADTSRRMTALASAGKASPIGGRPKTATGW